MSVEFFRHENMIAAPVASTAIQTIWKTEDGVLLAVGTPAVSVLEATDDTYAPGCIYIKSLVAGSSVIYINEGTKAVPDFDAITTA